MTSWPMVFSVEKDRIERFRELVGKGQEGGEAPFSATKDVFLAAAAIGRARNEREKLASHVSLGRLETFGHRDHMVAMAIANAESDELMLDGKAIIECVEEFANAGIEELYAVATEDSEHVVNVGDLVTQILGPVADEE